MNTPDATAELAIDAGFADALTSFIADEVALEDYPVDGDTDLLLTGLVDSLGVVMIVNWIEATLNTTIDPSDVVLENFQTIDQMLSFLRTA